MFYFVPFIERGIEIDIGLSAGRNSVRGLLTIDPSYELQRRESGEITGHAASCPEQPAAGHHIRNHTVLLQQEPGETRGEV